MQDSQSVNIYLMRHAETDLNKLKIVQGASIDSNINDAGIQNCKKICEQFKKQDVSFDLVFTSPLKRAVETAELISGFGKTKSQFHKIDQLKERDFKAFEGQPWSKMDEVMKENDLTDYNDLDIESIDIVKSRLQAFLETFQCMLNDSYDAIELNHILIVTHGEIFSTLLELMLERSTSLISSNNRLKFPYWPRNLQIAKLLFHSDFFNLLEISCTK